MSDATIRLALLAFIVIAFTYSDKSAASQVIRFAFLYLVAASICVDINLAWSA